MIRRLLLLALAAFGLLWWLRRFRRARQTASPGRRAVPGEPTDAMVRDRVCNTFLPRSQALTERVGSEEHFFCSERCRDTFLERLRA